ncbi:hypothetical protein [Hydrogenophaga luteola]|uniref:Uncharacterized protein n=1 Tax=Hydrogenophaga luteola TaxID=1591122 RepID=A0ABV7W751_9BURK
MSVTSGQRIVSIRKRILAYCEQHSIAVPKAFDELDPVYAIALVDTRVPERLRLVGESFYSEKSALRYLKEQNANPENYRFLDFKRGVELVIESETALKHRPSFDNRKDVDAQR